MDKQTAIIDEARHLPLETRKEIVNAIIRSIDRDQNRVNAEERLAILIRVGEDLLGVTYDPKRKSNGDAYIRTFAAKAMHEEGYSQSCIGRVMGRKPSTVCVMVQRADDIASGYFGDEWKDKYQQFMQRV